MNFDNQLLSKEKYIPLITPGHCWPIVGLDGHRSQANLS